MKVDSFQNLDVWNEAMDLVSMTYAITRRFPDIEKFALQSQMQRCAISIPSNIAEGFARKSNPDFSRFLRIAYGSSVELETQILIAERLEYIDKKSVEHILEQLVVVKKMLNKLMSSIS